MLIEYCDEPGLTLTARVMRRRDKAAFDFADKANNAFKPPGPAVAQEETPLPEGPPGYYSAEVLRNLTNWWENGDYTVRVILRPAGVVRALLLATMPDAR